MKRSRSGLTLGLALTWALVGAGVRASHGAEADTAKQQVERAKPDAVLKAKLDERLRLYQATEALNQQHKWAEAAQAGEKFLVVERQLLDYDADEVCRMLSWVADFYELAGNYPPAVKLRRESLPIAEKVYPAGDWRIVDAKVSRAESEAGAKLSAEQIRSLQGADELYARGLEHHQNERYAEAESLGKQSAAIRRSILGAQHRAYLSALVLVAAAQNHGRNDPAARPVLQQILDTRLKVLGENHPDTAQALNDLALNYATAELYEQAIPLQRRSVEVLRKCHGEENAEFATAILDLGTFCNRLGQHDEAEQLYTQALAIRRKVLGPDELDTAQAMDHLAVVHKDQRNYPAAETLLREAVELRRRVAGVEEFDTNDCMNSLGFVLEAQGKYAEAEKLFREVLEIRRKTLGSVDPDTAVSLNNLAEMYRTTGRYRDAEPLYLEALAANRQTVGDGPETAINLANLSNIYLQMRQFAKAKECGLEALELRKRIGGEHDAETARSLNDLGSLYQTLGDYAQAESYFQQALAAFTKTVGEESVETATTQSNLATLYMGMNDDVKAVTMLVRVLKIRQKLLGEEHPDVAMCWSNLASTYGNLGDQDKADSYHKKALTIFEKTLGADHPLTIGALCNVSADYLVHKDYASADALLVRAWESKKKTLGGDDPDTLTLAGHLGWVYCLEGKVREGKSLLEQSIISRRQTFGGKHPFLALQLIRLTMACQALGQTGAAEEHGREAVSILLAHLEETFSALSERQKLLMLANLRDSLDRWLTAAHDAHRPAEDLYANLLGWKGVVFGSETALRSLRSDPDTAELFQQYQEVSQRLSTAALALPRNFDERTRRDKELQELTETKEAIEQRLSRLDARFRHRQQEGRLTPEQLQNLLPPEVALVDFFEYKRICPAPDGSGETKERQLIAFVVRRGQPLVEVELGPTEPIATEIERWRACFGAWTGPAEEDPGRALRRKVWEPIGEKCGDAQTILISPDGATSQLPFAALPGDAPGEFLLHKYAIATIPVPQSMPRLFADETATTRVGAPSLLAVGDVDYGGTPGKADENAAHRSLDDAVRSASLAGFTPLPGTLTEIDHIDQQFQKRFQQGLVKALERDAATEAAFRELAPQYRWLHVSTHGFFAPEKLTNTLERGDSLLGDEGAFSHFGVAMYHPGLLSGLAMAGANRKPQPGEDDGILTALEVASLDLSKTEVVVLSACETGLGRLSAGEGVLGLQRAFQVAGAKTVVASLWSVPDQATMRLMERFYANLWERNMPKLEALREAQLWLLSDPANQSLLTAEERAAAGNPKYLPPQAWAAFVLSGDWR